MNEKLFITGSKGQSQPNAAEERLYTHTIIHKQTGYFTQLSHNIRLSLKGQQAVMKMRGEPTLNSDKNAKCLPAAVSRSSRYSHTQKILKPSKIY